MNFRGEEERRLHASGTDTAMTEGDMGTETVVVAAVPVRAGRFEWMEFECNVFLSKPEVKRRAAGAM